MGKKPDPKRLAEQLRANLRRRKQQQKARAPQRPAKDRGKDTAGEK